MSTKYAYVPFDDGGLLNYVTATTGRHNQGRFFDRFSLPVRQHRDAFPNVLTDVGNKKQLYIFGHGAPASDSISDNQGNRLSMAGLADRIKAAGLKTGHKEIKLFSCSGGVGDGLSMASRLYRALRIIGYHRVVVYGYTESLHVTGVDAGHKSGVSGKRAKDVRVKFG